MRDYNKIIPRTEEKSSVLFDSLGESGVFIKVPNELFKTSGAKDWLDTVIKSLGTDDLAATHISDETFEEGFYKTITEAQLDSIESAINKIVKGSKEGKSYFEMPPGVPAFSKITEYTNKDGIKFIYTNMGDLVVRSEDVAAFESSTKFFSSESSNWNSYEEAITDIKSAIKTNSNKDLSRLLTQISDANILTKKDLSNQKAIFDRLISGKEWFDSDDKKKDFAKQWNESDPAERKKLLNSIKVEPSDQDKYLNDTFSDLPESVVSNFSEKNYFSDSAPETVKVKREISFTKIPKFILKSK